MQQSKQLSKKQIQTLALSSLGGALEFYDFIIYVFFASYIAKLFFPAHMDANLKDYFAFGIFAAGYLARPLGGIVIAHFGDKFGRKNVFMLSILLMVIPTFAVSFFPTYEHIGYFAPILLVAMRFLQGIAIGGEVPGAWVFVNEHSPKNQNGFYLGVLTASIVSGILLGNLIFLLVHSLWGEEEILQWAWRVPFFIGGIFGIISIYLRKFLSETPVFQQMQEDKALEKFPLKEIFKTSRLSIVVSMLVSWILTGCILILILLAPTKLIGDVLQIGMVEKTLIQVLGIFCIMVGTIVGGAFHDRSGLRKSYSFCAWFFILTVLCFFYVFYGQKDLLEIVIFYGLVCFASGIIVFTPIVMCGVFAPRVAFSGISFSYNIAYAIAGFFTPQLTLFLHFYTLKHQDLPLSSFYLAFYLVFLGLLAWGISFLFGKDNLWIGDKYAKKVEDRI